MLELMALGGKKVIPPGKIKKMGAGSAAILVLADSGNVWVIGDQYFSGTGAAVTVWTKLLSGVQDMWIGYRQALFLMQDGRYMFLGQNNIFPGASSFTEPTDVSQYLTYPEGLTVTHVSLSQQQLSFVFHTGQFANMGQNGVGGLGQGNTTPVRQLTMRTIFTDVVKVLGDKGTSDTSWLLRRDGTIWGSGNNSNGQLLGTGNPSTWKQIWFANNAIDLHVGTQCWVGAIELATKYSLYGSGYNFDGQFGAGTVQNITAATALIDIPLEQGKPELYFGLYSSRFKPENNPTIRYTGTSSGSLIGGGINFVSRQTTYTNMPASTLWGEYSCTTGAYTAAYLLINGQLYGVGTNTSAGLLPGLSGANKLVFSPLDTDLVN